MIEFIRWALFGIDKSPIDPFAEERPGEPDFALIAQFIHDSHQGRHRSCECDDDGRWPYPGSGF